MADDRTYIRVHDGLDENHKIEGLSDAAFRLLVSSWCYCSRNRSDGRIAGAAWRKRGTGKARAELVAAGLAEQIDGFVEMHDYLEHQRSAEEIRLLRENRGATGTLGNHVKWHVARRQQKEGCEHCYPPEDPEPDRKPIANAIANGSQSYRKPIAQADADADADAVREKENSSRGGSHVSSGPPSAPPRFPDHCQRHANVAEPGNCGLCGDARKANKARPLTLVGPSMPARVPHCGNCDETRHLETPRGVIRCPECHPRAEEAS